MKHFLIKPRLIKMGIFPQIELSKIQKLINSDIANINSKKVILKNNLNSSRKLKTIKINNITLKEDSKESQNFLLNKLKKIKANKIIKNQKSFAQMAKEIAEKNMTYYLSGYYDLFEGTNPFENENQSENYNDMNKNKESSLDKKDTEKKSTKEDGGETKKLKKNYSQDFITVRNRILKDKDKIKQYERLLINNKSNKVTINVKDKDYKDILSSYNALSQNKLIYENIRKNYKGSMISQYATTINELNPIIRIHEKTKHQNIKIIPSITKSLEVDNKNDYFDYDDGQLIDSLNDNQEFEIQKILNEKLFEKSL